jgi:hypothetical protein
MCSSVGSVIFGSNMANYSIDARKYDAKVLPNRDASSFK